MKNHTPPGHFPPCVDCGHRAWAHGDQSGTPADGEPCHGLDTKNLTPAHLASECPCTAYRHPESRT